MKILKLLNKKNFSIILIFFLSFGVFAEDQPIDIWNIDKEKTEQNSNSNELVINENLEIKSNTEADIYNMQSQKKNNSIKLEETLNANDIKIFGLFDPEDYDLEINMWSNSNGNELKSIFKRLKKIELSKDATEIMNIAILTKT